MFVGVGVGVGFTRPGADAAVDYAALVSARLAGTKGFAMDPSDLTLLWKDARVTPVSAHADPIGAWRSKYGTTVYDFIQSTAGNQPASSNLRSLAVATDDFLVNDGTQNFFNALNGVSVTLRAQLDSLTGTQVIFSSSRSDNGASQRFEMRANADGSLVGYARRSNGGGVGVTSAAGLVSAGVPFTMQFQVDYDVTDAMRLLLGGTVVATGAMDGVAGAPLSAASPLNSNWGRGVAVVNYMTGLIGRAVFDPSYLSDADLAVDRGYVEAIAL